MSASIPLLGMKDVANFRKYRWWAERGLIHWEHRDNGNYGTLSVRMCLVRLRALNDMVQNSVKESHESGLKFMYASEITEHQKFIDEVIELCKKAREQGMPDDKSAGRDLKRRRRKVIHVPGARAAF